MPELPEVQTLVDDLLSSSVTGRTITEARVYWLRSVDGHTPEAFNRLLKGRTIITIWRRAKYLVFDLDNGNSLILHLRMTGKLDLTTPAKPRDKHEHIIISFRDGCQLRFHDMRKFGRFALVSDSEGFLKHLGIEPLSPQFTWQVLAGLLKGKKTSLKPFLLDQRKVAGIGNIYADEALFEARLHPLTHCLHLRPAHIKALHQAIITVLQRGLRNMGTTLGSTQANFYSVTGRAGRNEDELGVFRRTGMPCPVCETPVRRMIVAQRSTHYCPHCQPIIAD